VLSDEEIRTLWHALPTALGKSKNCQRILKLCLVTGQRLGEVAGMSRGELNLQRRLWTLPGNRVKNAHSHTVPLSGLAVDVIKEAIKEAGDEAEFLFPSKSDDAPLQAQIVSRAVSRSNEPDREFPKGRFGLEDWSAHDLRRTVLTNLAQLGISPHVIAHIANHRSITKSGVTFANYVHYSYDSEKRQALDLWADQLACIIKANRRILPLRISR